MTSRGTAYGLDKHKGAPWVERARCLDADPELFSPLGQAHKQIEEAVAICRRCPVGLPCLIEGAATGDVWTIRGGRTGPEREAHRRRGLQPQQYPPHVPGVMWCSRCHMPFKYDSDDPGLKNLRLCPACRIDARDPDGRRHGVCVDCERILPMHSAGRCSGCFSQYRRIALGARWCQRCGVEFRPPPYKPKAHICVPCAATHPDRRVRVEHSAVTQ